MKQLEMLQTLESSQYKRYFFQGATLVPRTLVFFHIDKERDSNISISTESDIYSRAKKEWKFKFQNKEIAIKIKRETKKMKIIKVYFFVRDSKVG